LVTSLLVLPVTGSSAAADLVVKLPTEPQPMIPLAVSGSHVLVQGNNRFMISHDAGKTWTTAAFPIAGEDSPDIETADSRVGRVANGVVAYSSKLERLSAYSLVTNTVVGDPYLPSAGQSVIDKVGGLVLLQTWPTNEFSVHSLLDGTDRPVSVPEGSIVNLLPDGSLLTRSGAATDWYHQHVDGTTAKVLTISPGTGDFKLSGALLAFPQGTAEVCLLKIDSATKSCRKAHGKHEGIAALSSAGLLTRVFGKWTFYWYPLANGKLGSAKKVTVDPGIGGFYGQLSAENSPVYVASPTKPLSTLTVFQANGKLTSLRPTWAKRAINPETLALTPTAVLGGNDSESHTYPWVRSLASGKIGAARRLAGTYQVAASGARWATSGEKLRIFDQGRLMATTVPSESNGLQFSGPYLLARPACREAPLVTDDDCNVPAVLRTAAGQLITVPAATEDIFGELMVARTGDTTVASRTLTVTNFRQPNQPTYDLQLPEVGAEGYFTDVRLWGDWVAATLWPGTGALQYPVVVNYRTGETLTSPVNARLLALGDGVTVSVLPFTGNIQIWDFAHATIRTVPASAAAVGLNGARLAYLDSGKLVITNLAAPTSSAPRVLGVVSAKTGTGRWQLEIDVTKAVKAGSLELRNSAGKVIRTIKVSASTTGSLRGISWDGRTSTGKRAAKGTYSLHLIANAADSSGSVVGVDGVAATIGTLDIS